MAGIPGREARVTDLEILGTPIPPQALQLLVGQRGG
jgi:hypothetical protein